MPHFARGKGFDFRVDDLDHGLFDRRRGAGFTQKIKHQPPRADGGQRIDHVLTSILRRAAAHRLKHRRAFRVDVPARCNAQPALDNRRQVRDDVAKHIVGHNHVEPFGIFDKPHAGGIDVGVLAA